MSFSPSHAVDPQPAAERKRCFAPVVDVQTRVLVLGSLPGEKSLAAQQYYAHPQNQFWRLMGEVTGCTLANLDYPSRLAALLASHVGLWDVVADAHRAGSLDSQIRERNDNDLLQLVATLPALGTIAFNGATAARVGRKVLGDQARRFQVLALPSSSAAYTLAYADKARSWQALRLHLLTIDTADGLGTARACP